MEKNQDSLISDMREKVALASNAPVHLSQGNYLPVQQEKPDVLGQSKFGQGTMTSTTSKFDRGMKKIKTLAATVAVMAMKPESEEMRQKRHMSDLDKRLKEQAKNMFKSKPG